MNQTRWNKLVFELNYKDDRDINKSKLKPKFIIKFRMKVMEIGIGWLTLQPPFSLLNGQINYFVIQ